jgi:membrane protein DedA with SNARE-associated domain
MEELLGHIINYLMPRDNSFLYIFLFLSAVIENLFPPIPGDTITAFGAFLVGTGRLNYTLVYITTTTGSVAGFMSLFLLGKMLGKKYFVEKNYSFFSAESIHAAEGWFRKYGYFVVLGNRFLPGIRSVISIVSGISKLNNLKVLIFSIVSAAVWNIIWIHTGYLLGNNWETVKKKMSSILATYNIAVGIVILVFVAGYVSFRVFRKRRGGV